MNGIDYSKLRSLTAREIISALPMRLSGSAKQGTPKRSSFIWPFISFDDDEIFGDAYSRRRSANSATGAV